MSLFFPQASKSWKESRGWSHFMVDLLTGDKAENGIEITPHEELGRRALRQHRSQNDQVSEQLARKKLGTRDGDRRLVVRTAVCTRTIGSKLFFSLNL